MRSGTRGRMPELRLDPWRRGNAWMCVCVHTACSDRSLYCICVCEHCLQRWLAIYALRVAIAGYTRSDRSLYMQRSLAIHAAIARYTCSDRSLAIHAAIDRSLYAYLHICTGVYRHACPRGHWLAQYHPSRLCTDEAPCRATAAYQGYLTPCELEPAMHAQRYTNTNTRTTQSEHSR